MQERLAKILEAEAAIERLSEKVHGMILIGQDRDDLKSLTMTLAREAKVIAEMCGDPAYFKAS
jgi:hypothetical protein